MRPAPGGTSSERPRSDCQVGDPMGSLWQIRESFIMRGKFRATPVRLSESVDMVDGRVRNPRWLVIAAMAVPMMDS